LDFLYPAYLKNRTQSNTMIKAAYLYAERAMIVHFQEGLLRSFSPGACLTVKIIEAIQKAGIDVTFDSDGEPWQRIQAFQEGQAT
jgi:hypothetical protein